MNVFKLFLTKFKNLKKLNGINEEEFNPLEFFIREGKRVQCISWTVSDREAQRKELFDFLQFNETQNLKLIGGCLEKINLDSLYIGDWTKHLFFKDMPQVNFNKALQNFP